MHALIDGDILVYRIGYSTEDVPERLAGVRLRDYFNEITESLLISSYTTYLTSTDKSNYRFQVDSTYKANRVQPKPRHYEYLRNTILNDPLFHSCLVSGKEADDRIGINASIYPSHRDYIVVSIDKDLKQIPGWHYDFVKKRKFYVTKKQAAKFLYYQLLVGDSADNVPGITGIGESIGTKLLAECADERDCYRVVREIYLDVCDIPSLIRRGQLLKIQQKDDEPLWQPPELSEEEIASGASHLIKVDWKKSFERYSKRRAKKDSSTSQLDSTLNTPPSSDSTSPIG